MDVEVGDIVLTVGNLLPQALWPVEMLLKFSLEVITASGLLRY